MSLREGCNRILKADCVDLLERLNKGQKQGFQLTDSTRCPLCNGSVLMQQRYGEEIVVFFCNHIYHSRCLKLAMHKAEGGGEGGGAGASSSGSASDTVQEIDLMGASVPGSSRGAGGGQQPQQGGELVFDTRLKNAQHEAVSLKGQSLVCIICQTNKTSTSK